MLSETTIELVALTIDYHAHYRDLTRHSLGVCPVCETWPAASNTTAARQISMRRVMTSNDVATFTSLSFANMLIGSINSTPCDDPAPCTPPSSADLTIATACDERVVRSD